MTRRSSRTPRPKKPFDDTTSSSQGENGADSYRYNHGYTQNSQDSDDDDDAMDKTQTFRSSSVAAASENRHENKEIPPSTATNAEDTNEYDVYMGRGGLMNQFRFGSLYRKLVVQHFEEYKTTPSNLKREFAMSKIINPVRKKGGRFFVPTPDLKGWTQPSIVDVIAPKVMQALRDCKKEDCGHGRGSSSSNSSNNSKKPGDSFPAMSKKRKVQNGRQDPSSFSTKRQRTDPTSGVVISRNHPAFALKQRFAFPSNASPIQGDSNRTNNNNNNVDDDHRDHASVISPNSNSNTKKVFSSPAPAVATSYLPGRPNQQTTALAATCSETTPRTTVIRHNLMLSPLTPENKVKDVPNTVRSISNTTAATLPSETTIDNRKRTTSILVNEKGHVLNTLNRMNGPCGKYHALLIEHSAAFRSIPEDDEGRFVWDNIVSPVQQDGGTFMVCPESGKVDSTISHKTIQCITNALRDTSYLQVTKQEMEKQPRENKTKADAMEGSTRVYREKLSSTSVPKSEKDAAFEEVRNSVLTMFAAAPRPKGRKFESSDAILYTSNSTALDPTSGEDEAQHDIGTVSGKKSPSTKPRQTNEKNPVPVPSRKSSRVRHSKVSTAPQVTKQKPPAVKVTPHKQAVAEPSVAEEAPLKVPWDVRFRELMAFADEYDHCNVPQRWDDNPALGRFVKIVRQYWVRKRHGRKTPLTTERIAMLNCIGFVWDCRNNETHPIVWQDKFRELKKFCNKFGHCNVPTDDPKYEQLSGWVASMHFFRNMKSGEGMGLRWKVLSPKQEMQLEEIGLFSKGGKRKKATEKEKKPAIKRETAKPKKQPKVSPPSVKKKALASKTKDELQLKPIEKIKNRMERTYGNKKTWSDCFDMLTVFKENNGHTQVPFKRSPHNHPLTVLSTFVMEMRQQKLYKQFGQPYYLTDEQEDLLDSIGFEWYTASAAAEDDVERVSLYGLTTKSISAIKREEKQRGWLELAGEEDREIVDAHGAAWKVYKPVAVDELFKNEEDTTSPQNVNETTAAPMDYDSDDSDDCLVF